MSAQSDLAESAACYCFDEATAQKIIIYLLAQNAGLSSMTPAELAEAAKCYCFDKTTAQKISLYLLANMTGSGSGIQCGNYAGGEPTFTPTTCGVAIDTSNERIWWYYNGAWH